MNYLCCNGAQEDVKMHLTLCTRLKISFLISSVLLVDTSVKMLCCIKVFGCTKLLNALSRH